MIFWYPQNEHLDYIKRVVGLPGDHLEINRDQIVINGTSVVKIPITIQKVEKETRLAEVEPDQPYGTLSLFPFWESFRIYQEHLGRVDHWVQHDSYYLYPPQEITVPEGYYFVMGDNRDRSEDSRAWGFVPRENIKGRAMFIWLFFDWSENLSHWLRWRRFGRPIR